jgi:MFS family permease
VVAVGGYTVTAILSGAVGLATAAVQVGVLRTGAWVARGVRGPSRNALLADAVPAMAYGRAYGFERSMDNLGAIVGPLLAIALVAATSARTAIVLSAIPGLMAAAAMWFAVRRIREQPHAHVPFRVRVRPVLQGALGRILLGAGAFELGNLAATLMILRATELLEPTRGTDAATTTALWLYVAYNVAATLSSVPAGRLADRTGPVRTLALGVLLFLVAYVGFASTGADVAVLLLAFVLAGLAIGTVETSEHTAVAGHAPDELRGSAFGLLAAGQSVGNLVASGGAGVLWTLVGPSAAFLVASAWMGISLILLAGPALRDRPVHRL